MFLRYQINRLMWNGLDALFPPTCPGCGEFAVRWCEACQQAVEVISDPVCEVCGMPLEKSGRCLACLNARPHFDAMRSWAVFNGTLRDALHNLKYKRNFGLGISLAEQIHRDFGKFPWPVDALVPIPLSRGRQAQRGYNQVMLVAVPLADSMNLPTLPSALCRMRETRTQVGLNAHERRQNVQQIFQADSRLVRGRRILLMDDVITTGATIADAARALREAGASAVYAFSIARAPLEH